MASVALAGILVGLGGCGIRGLTRSVLLTSGIASGSSTIWSEPFDELDARRWREVEVNGQTHYSVVTLDDRQCLRAESRGEASILLSRVEFDPEEYRWLSWEWRVDELVDGEALEHKKGSDASARVYVYFKTGGLPWTRHNLDYVWSATLPVGTLLNSAYSSHSKIIVVESGTEHVGQWRTVARNVKADYEWAFGKDAPDVAAIGIMNDTDNTGGKALAFFDNLRVSRRAPGAEAR